MSMFAPTFFSKSSLLIYLVKICDLFRAQILQVPLITLTISFVLGLISSNIF